MSSCTDTTKEMTDEGGEEGPGSGTGKNPRFSSSSLLWEFVFEGRRGRPPVTVSFREDVSGGKSKGVSLYKKGRNSEGQPHVISWTHSWLSSGPSR